jgi:hypothetical protein
MLNKIQAIHTKADEGSEAALNLASETLSEEFHKLNASQQHALLHSCTPKTFDELCDQLESYGDNEGNEAQTERIISLLETIDTLRTAPAHPKVSSQLRRLETLLNKAKAEGDTPGTIALENAMELTKACAIGSSTAYELLLWAEVTKTEDCPITSGRYPTPKHLLDAAKWCQDQIDAALIR